MSLSLSQTRKIHVWVLPLHSLFTKHVNRCEIIPSTNSSILVFGFYCFGFFVSFSSFAFSEKVGWRALAFGIFWWFSFSASEWVWEDEFFLWPIKNLKFAWYWRERWRIFLGHLGLSPDLFWGFRSAFLLLGRLLLWPPPPISPVTQHSGICSFLNSVISYLFKYFSCCSKPSISISL